MWMTLLASPWTTNGLCWIFCCTVNSAAISNLTSRENTTDMSAVLQQYLTDQAPEVATVRTYKSLSSLQVYFLCCSGQVQEYYLWMGLQSEFNHWLRFCLRQKETLCDFSTNNT